MKDVLEHLDNPIKCLKEIKRTSKNGCKVVISTPNCLHYTKLLLSIKRSLFKNNIPYNPHIDHSLTWGIPELLSLFKKAGYNKINIGLIEHYGYEENRNVFKVLKHIIPYHLKYSHIYIRCLILNKKTYRTTLDIDTNDKEKIAFIENKIMFECPIDQLFGLYKKPSKSKGYHFILKCWVKCDICRMVFDDSRRFDYDQYRPDFARNILFDRSEIFE